jgi:hypothetical protein
VRALGFGPYTVQTARMSLPLTLTSAVASCRPEAPLPADRQLRLVPDSGQDGVFAAAQAAFADRGWPIVAETTDCRELFHSLDKLSHAGISDPTGVSCAAAGNDAKPPFEQSAAGGGALLLDPRPGPVLLTRIEHDIVRDFGDFFRQAIKDLVPDVTLAGLPLQSNARRDLVAAVPSALKSYLPWSGTHDAHILAAIAIATAALDGSIPPKALRLPEAPRSIAIAASQDRSFLGVLVLQKNEAL